MKIALCLSGQPRSFDKGFEYINKNLLSQYDCDVFIHTWNYDFFDYTKLFNLYKPKCSKIGSSLENDYQKNTRYCKYNVVSSLYGVYKSIKLVEEYSIENKIKYDWVIKTRFDYALNLILDFNNMDSEFMYAPISMNPTVCNDQIAISSYDNMKKYSKTYVNLDKLLNSDASFCGEDLISHNLKYYGLWDNLKFLDMNDPFPPGNYDSMYNSLIRDDFNFWENV